MVWLVLGEDATEATIGSSPRPSSRTSRDRAPAIPGKARPAPKEAPTAAAKLRRLCDVMPIPTAKRRPPEGELSRSAGAHNQSTIVLMAAICGTLLPRATGEGDRE